MQKLHFGKFRSRHAGMREKTRVQKRVLKKLQFFFSHNFGKCGFILAPFLSAQSRECVCVFFRSVSAPFLGPPHGIPNISIPVDAFDVFEATQHTLEHDSKHGRGSPSVEQ